MNCRYKCQKVQNAGIILQLDNPQKDEMATLPYTMLPAVFLKKGWVYYECVCE